MKKARASKMTERVNGLAAKCDCLSSGLGVQVVKGENGVPQAVI